MLMETEDVNEVTYDLEGRIINLSDSCSGIVLPNLHIDENDVEASHSCSVGSVNQDHIYYLESRGLSNLQARNILIKGYFNPLLENINNDVIKNEITAHAVAAATYIPGVQTILEIGWVTYDQIKPFIVNQLLY